MRSLKLGSVLGIGLYIHWSFLILPLWVAIVATVTLPGNWTILTFMELLFLSIFTCVMLHELGHAFMARRFGVKTRDITLYPIGGVARLERIPERPWEEFWIAIAGPMVNVIIAGLLMGARKAGAGGSIGLDQIDKVLAFDPRIIEESFYPALILWILFANISLVAFNMLPAFPMDGGRVLRALLASCMSHLRATEWAAGIGGFVAVGMIFHPLTLALLGSGISFNPMLSLVGVFVFFVGQNELRVVRYKAAYGQDPPMHAQGQPMQQYIDASAVPAEANFSGFTFDRHARAWIEWQNGQPIHASYTE